MYIKLLACSAVSIALLVLCTYASWSRAEQERFFTKALTGAGIALSGQETLATLRTTYARTLAERNPLLALPGTDLERLSANIVALSTLEEQFVAANASSSDRALLRALYPTDFLEKLAQLEGARRQFVTSGSSSDEAVYIAAAAAAFSAYEQDAYAFKSAFARAVPQDSARFATDGNIIGRADTLDSIDTLVRAMRTTKLRFVERIRCTRGDVLACDTNELVIPAIPVTPMRAVTSAELDQARTVRTMQATAHQDAGVLEGPMYLLPSTKCVTHIPGAPLFSFYTPLATSSYSGPFPLLVGNIRFNNTDAARGGPGFKAFSSTLKQQVDYILDSPLLHYSCIQLAHDSGTLFTMRATYEFAQTHTLSRYANTTAQRQSLATLERRHTEVVSQHMVEAYLNTAREIPLPKDIASRVRDLSLSYIFKSERFDANLGEILNDETSNLALVQLGWPISVDVPYVFFIRSSAQMLLMADNPSAVGVLPKLFPPNTIPAEEEPFVYYSQLPHDKNSIAQLVRDIHFFYIIHVDPHLTGL